MYERNATGESFEAYGVVQMRYVISAYNPTFAIMGINPWNWMVKSLEDGLEKVMVRILDTPVSFSRAIPVDEIRFYNYDGALIGKIYNVDTE